ncbi:hypothetical protein RIF29_29610 [Crotalaria pallida]|uniref:RING-type E3 ubiquitin transferase n=1 Tax=Crotalaria pallida TaxID=3830 RepID=A0AAN9ELN3_CROPI
MRIRQFYRMQNEISSDPAIGSSHRSSPSSSSPTTESGESFIDNQSESNINFSLQENFNNLNHTDAQATTFPSLRQNSQEMDTSIRVEQSSSSASNIQVDANSEADFASTSSIISEMRRDIEFRHSLMDLLRAGGNLQIELQGLVDEEYQNDDVEDQNGWGLTDEEIVTSIRHKTFELVNKETIENKEACGICQEDYVNGEKIGQLDCSHKFHIDCIRNWLVRKNICPSCKRMALLPIYVDYAP